MRPITIRPTPISPTTIRPTASRPKGPICQFNPASESVPTSRSPESVAALPLFAESNSATSTSAWCAASPPRPTPASIPLPSSRARRPSRPRSWKSSTPSPATPSTSAAPSSCSAPSTSPSATHAASASISTKTKWSAKSPTIPAPPNAVKPVPEPPVEMNVPPMTELQTWAALTVEAAEANAAQRKPPARAGLPPEKKNAVAQKEG